jgi:spermidine/putrescine-binding protein
MCAILTPRTLFLQTGAALDSPIPSGVWNRSYLLGLLVLLLGLSACGGEEREVSSTELELYTWTGYVPDSVIEGFEERYGLQVNVTFYDSNEEAIAGIRENPGR